MDALKPMSREDLKAALELIGQAEAAMGELPHRLAVPAIRHLTELRDVLGEMLPGGFYLYCEACELPIGCDEETASDEHGDVTICGDCVKRFDHAIEAAPSRTRLRSSPKGAGLQQ